MVELLRTTDPVRISWITALLADARIGTVVLDTHTSIAEGSLGVLPSRMMVDDDDIARARRVLDEAGESYFRG